MMRITRTIVALSFLSLLPSFGGVGQSQTSAAAADSRKTFTISGTVGLPGVLLRGLPGDPITDDNGVYTVTVPQGWAGSVKPTKPGYIFEPQMKEYGSVDRDYKTEDYRAKIITYTISGNVGLAGVVMTGLPGDPITDERGVYRAEVEYGWSGNVAPHKEGYRFEPPSRMYPKVTTYLRNEDYRAQPRMVYISDWIRAGSEPITEVKVTADPGGQSVLTDLHGRYVVQVPYGWTGRLIFSKEGFVFDPDSRLFTNVTTDILGEEPAPSGKRPTPPSRTQAYPRAVLAVPAGNVFVIPTSQVAPQKLAETADDLRVMLQIFREKLSEPRLIRGAFVDFGDFFSDRDRALEAFYLQGSAAVFVLEMDAPFSFAPPQTNEGQTTQDSVDVVWQRARQKLYAPQDPATRGSAGLSGETERMDFQQFKDDLLKTFRHAANLRNMEPNEAVVLMIKADDESAGWPGAPVSAGGSYSNRGGMWFGGGSYSSSSGAFGPAGGTSQADSRSYSRGSASSQDRTGRPSPGSAPAVGTVLTIQAKKADVDAFAKGSLSFEQFQQRVKTFTY